MAEIGKVVAVVSSCYGGAGSAQQYGHMSRGIVLMGWTVLHMGGYKVWWFPILRAVVHVTGLATLPHSVHVDIGDKS